MNFFKTNYLFHPVIFGLYPIISLYIQNMYEIELTDMILPALVILFLIILFIGSGYLVHFSLEKISILLSISFILNFSYIPLRGLFNNITLFTIPKIGYPEYITVIYGVFFLLFIYFLIVTKRDLNVLTILFNFVAIGLLLSLVIFALPQITSHHDSITPSLKETTSEGYMNNISRNWDGDIYYIIIDRYPGAESLRALYKYDNRPFMDNLTQTGFRVINHSRSNYAETILSLPSSLNMQYLEAPLTEQRMANQIEDNSVMQFLKERGYSVVFFRSTYMYTNENRNADLEFNDRFIETDNNFQKTLMLNSYFLRVTNKMSSIIFGYQIFYPKSPSKNDYTNNTIKNITTIPELPGKKFVFAHIEIPQLINSTLDYNNDNKDKNTEQKIQFATDENYISNLKKFNPIILQMTDEIIKKSRTPPIIIIQSDHGVKYRPGIDNPEFVQQWTYLDSDDYIPNNFNAYYLPEGGDSVIYPSITPVNSFRLIFNYYFNTNYERLEDKTYIRDRSGLREIYWLNSS